MNIKLNVIVISAIVISSLGWEIVKTDASPADINSTILYVKAGANGDCTSWTTACELQTALNNAVSGDQIWVAAGTYFPTTTDDRYATFRLVLGVALFGGFPANGGNWESRDWVNNPTILSGDIGATGDSTDNAYAVVTGIGMNSNTILDGLTITEGNADGGEMYDRGGGMFNIGGNPTLSNIIFISNNASQYGGGMCNNIGDPTLSNVTFSDNSSIRGGGMFNRTSSPVLDNVTFSENHSGGGGGGMYNDTNSNPTLTNVIFSNNSAYVEGGGMVNWDSDPTLTNVTFSTNSVYGHNTEFGGGGMSNIYSNPSLNNVTFSGNTVSSSTPSDITYGGGMYNRYSDPILTNVTFSGNLAGDYGGGMANRYSDPVLTNVTFSVNSVSFSGGGMYNRDNSSPVITNAIFWDNTPNQITSASGSMSTVTYSDVEGGYTGTGNIDLDPLLGPLADNSGFTLTHALLDGSPAIDAGNPDPTTCPATDQRGITRPLDGDGNGSEICDIGSYEVSTANIAPTISDITDKNIDENTATGIIDFTIGDVETPLDALVVTAESSNTTLVPNGNITLGGSGANRTINIMPASNQSGTTTITITVNDGTDTANDTFILTVTDVQSPPGAFNKLNPINDAVAQPTSLTLSWGASSGANSYEYCLDTSNDNACSGWITTGTATSQALTGLNSATTYYWQVRALNTYGTTYANGVAWWSLTTEYHVFLPLVIK